MNPTPTERTDEARPRAADDNRLRMDADHLSLRALGPWLRDVLDVESIDGLADSLPLIELAIHEVCTNIVDHAYGPLPDDHDAGDDARDICVELESQGPTVTCRVVDRGRPFEPETVTPPDPAQPQERGYGLLLVEKIARRMSYDRTSTENVWALEFDAGAHVDD